MKKLLPILSLALILFGCKKSEQTKGSEPQKEETKYKVNFTIADFAATTSTMSTSGTKATTAIGDTLKNYANYLYYRIYNSNGVWVNGIDQPYSSANFGTITDQLPAGTYDVFFAASKEALSISDKSSSFNNATYTRYFDGPWNDTFAKTFSLTVGTSNITQPVRLDRLVGGFQVVLEDAIPAEAAKISVVISADNYLFKVNGSGFPANDQKTIDYQLVAADKGVRNKSFFGYVGNTTSTTSVIIRAYNSDKSLIVEKTIPDLQFSKGKRITLTGSLFPTTPANSSAGFALVVNPTWTTDKTVKF